MLHFAPHQGVYPHFILHIYQRWRTSLYRQVHHLLWYLLVGDDGVGRAVIFASYAQDE